MPANIMEKANLMLLQTAMDKEIIITTDGSHSVSIPEMGVTYHSSHGAIQESMHVFIEAGLRYVSANEKKQSNISVLEMGFGTGLNALLTISEAEKNQQKIYYETIELYPLEANIFSSLNYCEQLQRPDLQALFELIHRCPWNTTITVTPYFNFKKRQADLTDFSTNQFFDVVYFDAFAPEKQPLLWTAEVFKKLYGLMHANAVLTTYCSKSVVRKAMTEAGLKVEKIPGPPHKREMVRAVKL
ncbi:MAG: tRNA (5-methylaminomethyl-2-thiouridine)(34)-methyltransferase MnmD [Bacteroidota bacterium]